MLSTTTTASSSKYTRLSSSPDEPSVPLTDGLIVGDVDDNDDEEEGRGAAAPSSAMAVSSSSSSSSSTFVSFEISCPQNEEELLPQTTTRKQQQHFRHQGGNSSPHCKKLTIYFLLITLLVVGLYFINRVLQNVYFAPYLMVLHPAEIAPMMQEGDNNHDHDIEFQISSASFYKDFMEFEYRPKKKYYFPSSSSSTSNRISNYLIEISLIYYGSETKFKDWFNDRSNDSSSNKHCNLIFFWISGSYVPHSGWVCIDQGEKDIYLEENLYSGNASKVPTTVTYVTTYILFRQGSSTWEFRCNNYPTNQCLDIVRHKLRVVSITEYREFIKFNANYCSDDQATRLYCLK